MHFPQLKIGHFSWASTYVDFCNTVCLLLMLSLQEWVFPLLQNLQTVCGAHQSPTQWAWEGALFQGQSSQDMKLTTHLHLVLKLRRGAIPLIPLNALMAYTRTNVYTCTMFIWDCHLIQCLQKSCSTVQLYL